MAGRAAGAVADAPLPTVGALAGVPIHQQVQILDPAANAFGAVTTQGLELTLGL